MNVVNLVGVSEGDRVAIIRYSTNSFVDISLDSNQNLLLSVIASMQHLDRGTNTAEALLELPDQPWRQNALRIAIVMTDGLSNDKNATLHAVKQVRRDIRMPSLITFVVGVADYDRTEVLAIASSNSTVSDLDSFNTEDLTDTLERQTHQICYSGKIRSFTHTLNFSNPYLQLHQWLRWVIITSLSTENSCSLPLFDLHINFPKVMA